MMTIPDIVKIEDIRTLLDNKVDLSPEAWTRISSCATYLNQKVQSNQTFYGINTGFGSLCNVKIGEDDLGLLQENLICSHACGLGDEVPAEIVKIMLLLKIVNIAQGHSGVQVETVKRLIYFYNNDILPVVYQQGSLGASGDLAPLAHLSITLLGKGEANWNGQKVAVSQIFDELQLQPIRLSAKEGLGLLNGTQFMSSYAVYSLLAADRLSKWADTIAALSLDAFDAKLEPFNALIHKVRPHQGQVDTAAFVRSVLEGSPLQKKEKVHVQDPYSFRCVPQVHGATKDALTHIRSVVEIEINSVTDNPLVFEEDDLILSGGNFHGQPMAINLDYMAIAMAELANISERRTYLLISGQRGLPAFLVKEQGLNSGMMIAQYTAASIVSQNKQLCTPASVDSIVSSNGQEDHVSMGANAATKLKLVIDNVRRVLGVELMCACQALEFRRPEKTSAVLEEVFADFRKVVPFNDVDVYLHQQMRAAEDFLM